MTDGWWKRRGWWIKINIYFRLPKWPGEIYKFRSSPYDDNNHYICFFTSKNNCTLQDISIEDWHNLSSTQTSWLYVSFDCSWSSSACMSRNVVTGNLTLSGSLPPRDTSLLFCLRKTSWRSDLTTRISSLISAFCWKSSLTAALSRPATYHWM